MHRLRLASILGLLTCGLPVAAWAEDTIIDVAPCNVFCKLWRNASGTTQAIPMGSAPVEPDAEAPPPAASEGSDRPRPDRLVRQRGVVMVETPAERAASRRRKAALHKEITQAPTALTPPQRR